MLRITKIRSAACAPQYLERDDYYADRKSPSQWLGKGAEALGLAGAVDRETFQRLLAGEMPNGQKLGTMRDRKWQHKSGWDLTFSAPKSVSILAEAGGDRRLLGAHEKAMGVAFEYIEREAAITRLHTRQGGDAVHHEKTGNLVVAAFQHATSRAGDEQLHTHAIVVNATLSDDDKWRSLETHDMYQIRLLAGAIYQAELARECERLGYTPERINEHGQFELAEVPAEVRAVASKRTAQAEAWLTSHGYNPENADRKTWERAVLATREVKVERVMSELRAEWRAELKSVGFDTQAVAREARGRAVESAPASAREAVAAAVEHLSEREQVFSERELLRVSLVHGLGTGVTLAEVEAEIAYLRQRGELQNRELGGLQAYTSRAAIRLEKDMLAAAEKLRAGERLMDRQEAARAVERAQQDARHSWTTDQRHATETLLAGEAALACVQGHAGTAKTTTVLRTVAREYQARGYTVRAVAPQVAQAEILGRAVSAEGATLAQHLIDAKAGRLGGGRQVWIVDEASVASARLLRDLLRAGDRHGARVILVGDVRQLGSIEAGRAFAQVQERALTVKLEEIVRQRNETLRQGIYAAARGDVREALDKVERAGTINDLDSPAARRAAAARQYLALAPAVRENTLMVSTSRAGRSEINIRVREGLKAEGALRGEERALQALDTRDLTRAERKAAWSYQSGDLVRFGRDYKQLGLARGEYYRVGAIDQKTNRVHLVAQDGREIAWRPDQRGAKTAQVFRETERAVAQGDRIVWTRSGHDRELGLKNGERLEVLAVQGSAIQTRTQDGREVRLDLSKESHRHLDHAYCRTVHGAQGATADRVIVDMSARSPLAHQRSVYVAISRAREEAHIYTDTKTELARAAQERTGEKTAALENVAHEKAMARGRENERERKPTMELSL